MKNLDLIVKMQFGSHVYGTNVPDSDLDYKAIYLPSAKNILLQKVQNTYQIHTKDGYQDKNTKEDEDLEIFSLQRYLQLLLEGQTVALDMLFVPEKFISYKKKEQVKFSGGVYPHCLWDILRDQKAVFLHSGVSSFAGYCRTQANKYGIKGSRMRAVRDSIDFLEDIVDEKYRTLKLRDAVDFPAFLYFCQGREFANMVELPNKAQNTMVTYFEVVGRKFELGVTVKECLRRLNKIWNNYGERARQAMNNEGIDWKALMHAVRVQSEAAELLLTGHITFPRPEAPLLLKIRKGELPYSQVAELIENGLDELEQIQANSILPSEPDYKAVEQIILDEYSKIVRHG